MSNIYARAAPGVTELYDKNFSLIELRLQAFIIVDFPPSLSSLIDMKGKLKLSSTKEEGERESSLAPYHTHSTQLLILLERPILSSCK